MKIFFLIIGYIILFEDVQINLEIANLKYLLKVYDESTP